mmetsp:Transcript_1131/g.3698  ORF Transcript_1131/g.3698 Transcript_1131/m.3698 type:complete len:232 (-) Transcript_1131:918-1613(-)
MTAAPPEALALCASRRRRPPRRRWTSTPARRSRGAPSLCALTSLHNRRATRPGAGRPPMRSPARLRHSTATGLRHGLRVGALERNGHREWVQLQVPVFALALSSHVTLLPHRHAALLLREGFQLIARARWRRCRLPCWQRRRGRQPCPRCEEVLLELGGAAPREQHHHARDEQDEAHQRSDASGREAVVPASELTAAQGVEPTARHHVGVVRAVDYQGPSRHGPAPTQRDV